MKIFQYVGMVVCLLGAINAKGQSYYFNEFTETYTQLSNADVISTNFNSNQFWMGNYGVSIEYFGIPYSFNGIDGLIISSDGYVACAEYNDSTDITINGLLASLKSNPTNSGLYSKLEGPPGDRILKLEWRNVGFSLGASTDFINFQIWMYENQGTIELRYGPSSIGNNAYGNFSGPGVGFYIFSLQAANIGEKLESYFITGSQSSPVLTNYFGTGTPRMDDTPTDGTVYRFSTTSTTSVQNLEGEGLVVYPNPTNGYFRLNKHVDVVNIYNQLGQLVKTVSLVDNREIAVQDLKAGHYILTTHMANGEIMRSMLIKQ